MSEFFLEILNTGIMAGWLVLAVLVVRLPLKKAPAWVKCALWAIVALRLVWPFEIESIVSLIPSAQTLPPSELYNYTPQVHTGVSVLNSAINPTFTQTFETHGMNSVNPLQVAVAIASVIWALGMMVMAAYTTISYLRLRRMVRPSMPMGDGVYLCDNVTSPFILGIIKPKIYLPSDLPQEKREDILAHERAHLARRDHWWKPLGFLLLTVFWFHPLLWLAYILLCRDVELACDEKVIASLSPEEKQNYSQTLLECSVPRKWITACPLAFGETGVKQRIKAILHYKKPTLWILIIALIACTVLAVCFLTEPSNAQGASATDIAGKQYVYEGEGAGPGSVFYINIYQDGTYQYFEGMFSSHIGMGEWEVKNGKLYLYEDSYVYQNGEIIDKIHTYAFRVVEKALVYIADESHPFIYVDVKNGERFYYYTDISTPGGRDVPGPAEVWHMIHRVMGMETGQFQLSAFPNHTFRWGDGKIEIIRNGRASNLIENATIYRLGAVDLNLDGYPEICATVSTQKEGQYVMIHDIENQENYTLLDPSGAYVYYLYAKRIDERYYVMCAKDDEKTGKAVEAGRLIFVDEEPAIKAPALHLQSSDTVTVVFDQDHPDSAHQGQVELDGFQGVSVRWYYSPYVHGADTVIVKDGKETALFEGFPAPTSLYFADVTGDGKNDICAEIYYFFSGLPSYHAVCVYDYADDRYYILADHENVNHAKKRSYYLRLEDGKLVCDEVADAVNSVLVTGILCVEDNGADQVLCLKPLRTYDSPVDYTYVGEQGLDRVTLTVIHEGTCSLSYSLKPEGGVYTSGSVRGFYYKTDDTLYFHTEDWAMYVFRFVGEDLVFDAEKSDFLPENCILYDGAVLKANVRYR